MDGQAITTDLGTVELRPDGILHVTFDYEGEVTRELSEDYLAARNGLVGSESPPVLLQIIKFPYVERSIRAAFLAGLPHPPCRAVVSVDPTFITMWRTYDIIAPVKVPSKVLPTIELAVEWLHEQMEQG